MYYLAQEKEKVLIECDPDEFILKAIGFSKKSIRHEGGIGNVVKKVDSIPGSKGMIDEDPQGTHPRALDRFDNYGEEHGLRLLKKIGCEDQQLVVVCPYLEEWLYIVARQQGVDPMEYSLPRDPKQLHAIDHVEEYQGFKRFVDALKGSPGFDRLRMWLTGN